MTSAPLAGAIVIGLDPGGGSVPFNTLEIADVDDGSPGVLAFETVGIVLRDRVELRYSDVFVFEGVETPQGWRLQVSAETVDGQRVGVATYTYQGGDPDNDAEFYTMANGWTSGFRLVDPLAPDAGNQVALVDAKLFASAPAPGFGIVAVSEHATFLDAAVFAVPEPGRAGFFLMAGFWLTARRRRWGGGQRASPVRTSPLLKWGGRTSWKP